jgi:hypothetical protein
MRQLNRTFSDIFVKSGAFDTPTTERNLRTDTQGRERFTSLLRVIISIMDAFEVLWVCSLCGGQSLIIYAM